MMYWCIRSLLPSDEQLPRHVSTRSFCVYHGAAYRGDLEATYAAPRYFGDEKKAGLRLRRCITLLPSIICPAASLLLAKRATADLFLSVANVLVEPLARTTYVNLPPSAEGENWDNWYASLPRKKRIDPVSAFPVVPYSAQPEDEYFEVVVPRHERILPVGVQEPVFRYRVAGLDEVEERSIVIPSSFESHFAIFFRGFYFVRDDLFQRLKQIDPATFHPEFWNVVKPA